MHYNGTNFFLMREAVKRNPNITLYALSWSFPGWFAGRNALGVDQAEYSADWVDGVRKFHTGKLIMGVWNEQRPSLTSANYAKLLRLTLDKRGHHDVLVSWPDDVNHDGDWDSIAEMINADPALAKAVDWLSNHYPTESRTCPVSALTPEPMDYRSTCSQNGLAALTKKPLVDSEAWGAGKVEGDLNGGATMARMLNWEPIVGRISATVVWQVLWGSYDGLRFANNSLIRAASPWSGAFEMLPAGYAVAHHTRFSAVGWRYLQDGQGCGWLPGGGSYVTRVSPDGRDFSIVIETFESAVSCDCDTCSNTGPGTPLKRGWSVAAMQAVRLRVVSPDCRGRSLTRVQSAPFSSSSRLFSSMPAVQLDSNCTLTLTVPKNTQLTLSTLPMPTLETPAPRSATETPFPLPWAANFSGPSEPPSTMPSFFQDLNGAFALSTAFDGGNERVMEQVSRYVPIMWWGAYTSAKLPLTIFGSDQWVNISIRATVALVSPPIVDPFAWNSSYGHVKPDANGAAVSGSEVCAAKSPPLDCGWANTSATIALRVGGDQRVCDTSAGCRGVVFSYPAGYGYFFTVSVSGEWHLEVAERAPPPLPRQPCPAKGWKPHASGYWKNSDPHGTEGDTENATVPLCAKKCAALQNCLAFEVFDGPGAACYIFLDVLTGPFTVQPACITCVKVKQGEPAAAVASTHRSDGDGEAQPNVRILSSGHISGGIGLRRWHNLSLTSAGCRLRAAVDGVAVADVVDTGCDTTIGGWGAVGSGWHAAQFKDVRVAVPDADWAPGHS